MGPDNNMIHYHARYIGEDKMRAIGNSKVPVFDIVVTIDPDYGMSAVPGDSSPAHATFLVRLLAH